MCDRSDNFKEVYRSAGHRYGYRENIRRSPSGGRVRAESVKKARYRNAPAQDKHTSRAGRQTTDNSDGQTRLAAGIYVSRVGLGTGARYGEVAE